MGERVQKSISHLLQEYKLAQIYSKPFSIKKEILLGNITRNISKQLFVPFAYCQQGTLYMKLLN